MARCVEAYARAQVGQGLRVAVATPGGSLAERGAAAGATVLEWQAARAPGVSTGQEIAALERLVRLWRPDVVHLHSAKAGLAGRCAVRGALPTVFQPHAWSFDAARGPMRRGILAWERAAARWADLVLCVSEAERLRGTAHGVRARYLVQPGGADLVRFAPADEMSKARARDRLGLGSGPLAVCVGRLARQKGQDILLKAWPRVRQEVPAAALALVGDGPEAGRLMTALAPGATIAGPSDTPWDWYAAADVVVVPSRWEGFPLVPLEAMATARSVVGTAVTGMVEAIAEGTGALVRPGAVAPLATAIADRLAEPARAHAEGLTGRRHVEQNYDAAQLANRLPAIYTSLLP